MPDELNEALQNIKQIAGVENVVLVQKDGVPIASAGVWFTKSEVFAVASSTCAIFGAAKTIHRDFKYVLMESETSKVFLASLPNDSDCFLTITTAPRVNLAALFIEMKNGLSRISYLLRDRVENQRTPLRSYSTDEVRRILAGFSISEGHKSESSIPRVAISLDRSQSIALRDILRQVYENIPDITVAFLALNGGVRVSLDGFTNDRLAAMSFALYDASHRVVRTLRNSPLQSVLCETSRIRHMIYSVPNGVFSVWIDHNT
ncbi:MAG: roadblock/LC7 domain-containing protein, partial [Candidatus Thorarchaeota archaeon]